MLTVSWLGPGRLGGGVAPERLSGVGVSMGRSTDKETGLSEQLPGKCRPNVSQPRATLLKPCQAPFTQPRRDSYRETWGFLLKRRRAHRRAHSGIGGLPASTLLNDVTVC